MPRRLILLAALIAALAAAGCGDDDEPSRAETDSGPVPTQTTPERAEATDPEPTAPKETPAAVQDEKRSLERAGLKPEDSGVGGIPGAQGALELPIEGGGGLTVIAFETRAAAERHAEQYEDLAEKYPDYFRLEIRDTTLYLGVAEQPEKLTKTGFADAVKAATSSG